MARMNEILTGRHNRFLQKHFSMKGEPPAPQLSSEIMPVHPFHSGAENRYLESWNRFGAVGSIASVLNQVTAFRLRNPPTSNTIAVLEKIVLNDSNVAQLFNFAIGPTIVDLLSGNFGSVRLDARMGLPLAFNSVLIPSFASNAPGVPATMILFQQYNVQVLVDRETIQTENQELTLLPGDALDIREQSVPGGEALRVNFLWRERQIEESERF